jgi:parallel beta-helix repeat protein
MITGNQFFTRAIVFVTLTLFVRPLFATNYYFSSTLGDDNRTSVQAQSQTTPWKSLNKLNSFFINLRAGDSVLLKRGDVFYGSIIVAASGTVSQPIAISAYGSGTKPVITGLVNLSGWVTSSTGIWDSYSSQLGNKVNVVLINGIAQEMGRYPNSNAGNKGYLTLESHTNNTAITDLQLSSSPNWNGAEVVIRKKHWIIDRHLITNHSGTTLTYATGSSTYDPLDNFGYFIQNSRQTLDQSGEWYYNPSKKSISVYFGSNSPSSYTVKASAIDNLVRACNYNNVVFDGLAFEGANTDAIFIYNASNVRVNNCDIQFSGESGIAAMQTQKLSVENCSVKYSNNDGLDLRNNNDYAVIRNNKIENTHLFAGMGENGDGNGAGILAKGQGILLEYNQIINSGYVGVSFGGDYTVVKNNFINNFCLVKDDGGGIYTFTGRSTNITNYGRKVIGNIILNGIGAGEGTLAASNKLAHGIMLDDNVTGVELDGNTVANVNNNGIFLQYSREIAIRNNTLFNNGRQLHMSYGSSALAPIAGNTIFNNILFSKLPTQFLSSFITNTTEINFGRFDSNLYVRPVGEDVGILNSYSNGSGGTIENPYDLSRWKIYKKEDYNGKSTPVKIPEYTIKSQISPNQFTNGSFNTNIAGVGAYSPSGSIVKSFNGDGVLDGGNLQISFTPTTTKTSALVTINIGAISSSKKYILKYSMKGSNDNTAISIYLRQSNAPFSNLTQPQYRKISATRTEDQVLFYLPPTQDAATVVFKVDNPNVQFWLDNVQFYAADVELTKPDDYIRFEYNATSSSKTVTLDATYVDATNKAYSNNLTLAPYSSIVLIKKAQPTTTYTQTTAKANQTINFPAIPNRTYGDAPFALTATASSGLPVSYRIVSGQASISGDTIALRYPGTVVVEASQAGNATYNPASAVTQSFDVAKGDQTITFPAISGKTYGDAPFKVSAWSSSGLQVSLRVVSGPASVSGNVVTLNGTGTVTIEASHPGNNYYNAASPVKQSFAVSSTQTSQRRAAISEPAAPLIETSTNLTAYPNPFRDQTTIKVKPRETGPAVLELYDFNGRLVRQIFNGSLEVGVSKSFVLQSQGLASGTYIIRFSSHSGSMTEKIALIQ